MTENVMRGILRTKQTVFSFDELLLLWPQEDEKKLQAKINYYVKIGELYHIRRGLYAKDVNYDRFELATKIFTPSYISFETVLSATGITFQYYKQIFVATYQSRNIICDGQPYNFKTIRSVLLTNTLGVEIKPYYSIAIPERAFLDIVYLNKDYHFDNLAPLNWDKIYEILPIYGGNKRMIKMIKMYHALYKNEG